MLKYLESEIFEIKESNIHKDSWTLSIKDTEDCIVIGNNEVNDLIELLQKVKVVL